MLIRVASVFIQESKRNVIGLRQIKSSRNSCLAAPCELKGPPTPKYVMSQWRKNIGNHVFNLGAFNPDNVGLQNFSLHFLHHPLLSIPHSSPSSLFLSFPPSSSFPSSSFSYFEEEASFCIPCSCVFLSCFLEINSKCMRGKL